MWGRRRLTSILCRSFSVARGPTSSTISTNSALPSTVSFSTTTRTANNFSLSFPSIKVTNGRSRRNSDRKLSSLCRWVLWIQKIKGTGSFPDTCSSRQEHLSHGKDGTVLVHGRTEACQIRRQRIQTRILGHFPGQFQLFSWSYFRFQDAMEYALENRLSIMSDLDDNQKRDAVTVWRTLALYTTVHMRNGFIDGLKGVNRFPPLVWTSSFPFVVASFTVMVYASSSPIILSPVHPFSNLVRDTANFFWTSINR